MLEKEVKQYKRGNSFTYRIDLSKKDNFDGGEKVMILTLDEYEDYINAIENYKNQINQKDTTISDLKDQNNNIKLDVSNEVDKRNEEISKKNDEIKNLIDENKKSLQKCYDIIDEKDKSLNQSNEEIRLEREKSDKIVNSKDDEIKSLNSRIKEQDQLLVGYRLLIEKYKSRSFIDRLLNREISEDSLKPKTVAGTYVLESDKDKQ